MARQIVGGLFLLGVAAVLGQVAVPSRRLGYVYKDVPHCAPINIEFFIDLLCPDSKAAFPVMKEIGDHYGNLVRIAVISFPLPYHRNAFLAGKGIQVVNNMTYGDTNKIYDWIGEVFSMYHLFGEGVNYDVPERDTIRLFASTAERLGLSGETFMEKLTQDDDLDWNARVEWKYACTRGVAATPWFIVNGVSIPGAEFWTADQWKNAIDYLLSNQHLVI